jgi:signal transduction histidine kinase
VTTLLESEAGKLQSLVQEMLDLERLALRDFHSTSSVIDLGVIWTKRIEFLRASTDRALSVSAAPSVLVRADAALIERVIDNLVGNALKYTEHDVDVRVAKYDGAAMIEVEDHGAGIAPADRARVFERFVRGATAAGTHGLGLGLPMVAEIARWHHGDVALEEAVSGGALFRVTLPTSGGQAILPVRDRRDRLSSTGTS